MISKYIKYRNNYYKFTAKVYLVPGSFNRKGVDPFPRFFMRPEVLLEVLAYSKNSKSTDSGFWKDEESGLYLRNRDEIGKDVTIEEIDIQFEYIRMLPPFWFHDEGSFIEFMRVNMEPIKQKSLENLYVSSPNKAVSVEANENPDLPAEHLYKKINSFTTRSFEKEVTKEWPVEKGVIISKLG